MLEITSLVSMTSLAVKSGVLVKAAVAETGRVGVIADVIFVSERVRVVVTESVAFWTGLTTTTGVALAFVGVMVGVAVAVLVGVGLVDVGVVVAAKDWADVMQDRKSAIAMMTKNLMRGFNSFMATHSN